SPTLIVFTTTDLGLICQVVKLSINLRSGPLASGKCILRQPFCKFLSVGVLRGKQRSDQIRFMWWIASRISADVGLYRGTASRFVRQWPGSGRTSADAEIHQIFWLRLRRVRRRCTRPVDTDALSDGKFR